MPASIPVITKSALEARIPLGISRVNVPLNGSSVFSPRLRLDERLAPRLALDAP